MHRLLVTTLATLVVLLGSVGGSAAADVVRIPGIDITFSEPVLKDFVSDACGFPVYVHGEGTLTVTLQHDRAGRLVRETYSSPGAFVTYFAPSTGAQYRFPWLPRETFTYPGGATVGGPALFHTTGLITNHPGSRAEAGVLVITGTVVEITDGVPIVESSDEQFAGAFARGSLVSPPDPTPGICAALAAA